MKLLKRIKNWINKKITETKICQNIIKSYQLVIENDDKIIRNIKTEAKKWKDLAKGYDELIKRRDEFIKRIRGKIPDNVLGNFADYKFWLAEPFISIKYEPYIPPKDNELFIDGTSAIKGILKAIDDIESSKEKKK